MQGPESAASRQSSSGFVQAGGRTVDDMKTELDRGEEEEEEDETPHVSLHWSRLRKLLSLP